MQAIESTNGGAAPADRQCQFTKSDGFRCRDWALRGHQHCFRHHQYLHSRPENPVDVPLLEDEDSLASLLSQTLRALAWGTIPAANGRAILAGCRIMQGLLNHRLAKAKFHAKLVRLNLTEEQIVEAEDQLFERQPSLEPEAEPILKPAEDPRAPQPVTSNPQPVTPFPDVRKEWDRGLSETEQEMMELRFPPRDEKPNPFTAARRPLFTPATPEQWAASGYPLPLTRRITPQGSASSPHASNQ